MKPRLSVVFPYINDKGIADITIEKMYLSKARRSLKIVFGENTTERQMSRAEKQIKKCLHLNRISSERLERVSRVSDRNVIIYNVSSEQSGAAADENGAPNRQAGESVMVEDMLCGKPIKGRTVPISSLNENSGKVIIRGKIFSFEDKDITSKKNEKTYHLVTMNITDLTDSITIKMFVTKQDDEEKEEQYTKMASKIKKGVKGGGIYVVVRGTAQHDDYMNECVVMARDIAEINPPAERMDNAPKKRVELHLHTQMSQMEAVSSTAALVNRAVKWGHKAIAITDHGVVQSYPDAMHASDYNSKIKILYGVEGYLLNDDMKIIYDTEYVKSTGWDNTFVVFDLETTGFDKKECKIIEIGAVKIRNGEVIDTFSEFVDPEQPIPPKITELTSITDSMVEGAEKIEVMLPRFKEFCKDCVLVAHNALFDVGFMKEKARQQGTDFEFCYMDTLTLGRAMYPGLTNHKLDTISKHLNVIL